MKKDDYVKIQNVGIGKIEYLYDDMDVTVNICETRYYRNLNNDTDLETATEQEYIEFLKFMVKQLTATSKNKRKDAASYNKETNGQATKRKGKVTIINGNYALGLSENLLSQYHSSLLSDARKAKELKEKLKKEIEQYKLWQKLTGK